MAARLRSSPPRVAVRIRHTGVFPTIFNARDPISEAKRKHTPLHIDGLGLDLDPDTIIVRH